MTINRDIYKDGDRWYADKDPDNKWHYVADISSELTLNSTTATAVTAIPDRMTVTLAAAIQTSGSSTFVVVQVTGPTMPLAANSEDPSITFRVTCANGDIFDKTLYFKAVSD